MRLLRVAEVAEILRVPQARTYELIRQGLLPAVHLGRQLRVSEPALIGFIETGGKPLAGGWRRERDGAAASR